LRKAGVYGIIKKEPKNVLDAMKIILKKYMDNHIPVSIQSDDGNEYKGVFSKWCKDNEIKRFIAPSNQSHTKQGIIERFNYTLSRLINEYTNEKDTSEFIDDLPIMIEAYNNAKHSSTGHKPIDIWDGEALPMLRKRKKADEFVIGDIVRIKLRRGVFTKGRTQRYSTEIYKIISRGGHTYECQDEEGDIIEAKYDDILKANAKFEVKEKVISKKSKSESKENDIQPREKTKRGDTIPCAVSDCPNKATNKSIYCSRHLKGDYKEWKRAMI